MLSQGCLKKKKILSKNTFLYFCKKLKLFVSFFFRKVSIFFTCTFTSFVFFLFRKIFIQIARVLTFFDFFYFIKFIFYKELPVSISSILTFFLFFFFRNILRVFRGLFFATFLCCLDNILMSFFFKLRRKNKPFFV